MRRSATTALIFVLALGACSGGGDTAGEGKAVDNAKVAEKAAEGPQLRPGLYEARTTVLDFTLADMPGMPAGMGQQLKDQMAANMAKPRTYCLTPDQAAEGRQEMLKHLQDGNCTVARYDTSSTGVDAEMTCQAAGGASSHIKVNGTMNGDSSTMTMESTQKMPQVPGDGIHMKMRVDTKRIGDCPA